MLNKFFFIFLLIQIVTACTTTPVEQDKATTTALVNTQLGMAYLEKNNIQQAKKKLLLALEQAPNVPEPWYSMGYFLEKTGEKNQAETYYLKALSLAPNRGDVHNNYGTYLCRMGNYRGAIQHFLTATADPKYLETGSAYENAGLCAMKIPDTELAMHYFNKALIQDPNHPTALIELSELDYQQGNFAAAKQKLNQFLSISYATPQSLALSKKLGA